MTQPCVGDVSPRPPDEEGGCDEAPVVLTVGMCLSGVSDADILAPFDRVQFRNASGQAQAVAMMYEIAPAVVLIDLGLRNGSPLAVADFVSYRHPDARVIFVSDQDLFLDGSLFNHCANVHAHIPQGMAEPDMIALVAHHAEAGSAGRTSGEPTP